MAPAQGPRVESVDARPNRHPPNPHHDQVHFHDSFPHKQVSKSKHISYARWALSGKTQKNLIFGPEAVDCGGKQQPKPLIFAAFPNWPE